MKNLDVLLGVLSRRFFMLLGTFMLIEALEVSLCFR